MHKHDTRPKCKCNQPTRFHSKLRRTRQIVAKISGRGRALPLPGATGVPAILRVGPCRRRAALQLQLPRRCGGVGVGGVEHHLGPGASHSPEPARAGRRHARIHRPAAQDPGPPAAPSARCRTQHQSPQATDAYHLMAGSLSPPRCRCRSRSPRRDPLALGLMASDLGRGGGRGGGSGGDGEGGGRWQIPLQYGPPRSKWPRFPCAVSLKKYYLQLLLTA